MRTHFDDEIEHFPPKTDWVDILMVIVVGLAVGLTIAHYTGMTDWVIQLFA